MVAIPGAGNWEKGELFFSGWVQSFRFKDEKMDFPGGPMIRSP